MNAQFNGKSERSELIFDELDNAIGQAVLLQRGEVEVLYPAPLAVYVALSHGGKVPSVLFRRQSPSGVHGQHEFQERAWETLTAAQRVMVARGVH